MSSHTINIWAPNFLATEITYLALFYLSSSESPALKPYPRQWLIDRWIEVPRWPKVQKGTRNSRWPYLWRTGFATRVSLFHWPRPIIDPQSCLRSTRLKGYVQSVISDDEPHGRQHQLLLSIVDVYSSNVDHAEFEFIPRSNKYLQMSTHNLVLDNF